MRTTTPAPHWRQPADDAERHDAAGSRTSGTAALFRSLAEPVQATCSPDRDHGPQLSISGCNPLPSWAQTPAAGTAYTILGQGVTGTTTAGSTPTTLVDATQNWTSNAFVGQQVRLEDGPVLNNTCTIVGNTATQLTDLDLPRPGPMGDGAGQHIDLSDWAFRWERRGRRQRSCGVQRRRRDDHARNGHNLGLLHGGDVEANCKVNYVSVMNYDHQVGFLGGIRRNPAGGRRDDSRTSRRRGLVRRRW